ncbi:glycosyltransferase [Glutamicibacter sp.]|uniref:glycosyltransferase n=1 Tax=Glutamicibacter sp. TaxID=1931995 RepID=UPI0028BF37CA|nr:glycosyltransferase [Glutamicibacter sp.]
MNSSLSDGGSEKALLLVAQSLVERGHDVTMALVRNKPRTYKADSRIRIIQFEYGRASKVLMLWHRMRQLRLLSDQEKFDYVVCYMWDLNVMTLMATLGLDTKVVVSERAYPGAKSRRSYTRLLERLFYRGAHKIIYQTNGARKYCPAELTDKSFVVPNIIEDLELSNPTGKRERRIVSIGRLDTQKNFPLLLNSFAEFHRVNNEWTLEIYGQGPLEQSLKSLTSKLGIEDFVHFRGYVSDIPEQIRNAGMFVLTSDFEGISNAMTEAMAAGIPTICTDCPVGGASLMIENGKSGILVPVGKQDEIVAAMNRIAHDSELASNLSIGAIQSVRRFTPAKMSVLWEDEVLK